MQSKKIKYLFDLPKQLYLHHIKNHFGGINRKSLWGINRKGEGVKDKV